MIRQEDDSSVLGTIVDWVSDPIGSAVGGVADAAGWSMDAITSGLKDMLIDAVRSLSEGMTSLLNNTSAPAVGEAWYVQGPYRLLAGVCLSVTVIMFMFQIPSAVFRGDIVLLGKKALFALPGAVLAIMYAPYLTSWMLVIADELAGAFGADATTNLSQAFDGFLTAAGGASSPGAVLMTIVGLVLMLVSSFVLWLVLVLRAAALGLVVGIVPLAAAATLHERAKGMLEQTVKLLVAVVFSKALIFWALTVGTAYLAAMFPDAASGGAAVPNTTAGAAPLTIVTNLVVGSVILMCAALTPAALLKVIPGFEGAFAGGALGSGAGAVMGMAGMSAGAAAKALKKGSGGAGGSGGGTGGGEPFEALDPVDSVVGDEEAEALAASDAGAAATAGTGGAALPVAAGAAVVGAATDVATEATDAATDAGDGDSGSGGGSGDGSVPAPDGGAVGGPDDGPAASGGGGSSQGDRGGSEVVGDGPSNAGVGGQGSVPFSGGGSDRSGGPVPSAGAGTVGVDGDGAVVGDAPSAPNAGVPGPDSGGVS